MLENIINKLNKLNIPLDERETTINIYGKEAKIYTCDFHHLNHWKKNLNKLITAGVARVQELPDGVFIYLPAKHVHILGCKNEEPLE